MREYNCHYELYNNNRIIKVTDLDLVKNGFWLDINYKLCNSSLDTPRIWIPPSRILHVEKIEVDNW